MSHSPRLLAIGVLAVALGACSGSSSSAPTSVPAAPTASAVPSTNTPVPSTATAVTSTSTPVPPTPTAAAPTEEPEPTEMPAASGAKVADWNSQNAQKVTFTIASLNTFITAVQRGDVTAAANGCNAMRTNWKATLWAIGAVPDPAIDDVFERGRDAAYDAQSGCQDALKGGGLNDPVKLARVTRDATTAYTLLNQVLDQVQAAA
jgi:hypothetical protein